MGKKRTTTVTHPDGTVSTRKSETRTYTHAVAVGPAPAEAMASYLDRQAADRTADAAKLREAAASARVTVRDRRLGGNTRDLITHVAMLAGTEVHTWCSADGRTESHRDAETQVVEVGQYLRESALSSAEWREKEAAQRVAEAAAIRAAGVPVGGWSVVRWSSRADLAEAALSTFAHLAEQGRPVRVVPVDATPAPATPKGGPTGNLAAFRRAAVPGSRWQCVNHLHPEASGLRVITGGVRVLKFTGTRADGSPIGDGSLDFPKADAVRFEGDAVHFLHAPGDERVAFTWTPLPAEDTPGDAEEPAPAPFVSGWTTLADD